MPSPGGRAYDQRPMDPAPEPDSTVTMPSPARIVTRSVSMLTSYGYSRAEALRTVRIAARHAWADLYSIGVGNFDWLMAIDREAERRGGVLQPPSDDRKADDHGGKTSPGQTANRR